MSAPVFDVYISPGPDRSPGGQMKLVAAVAARFRLAAPQVAEGLQRGKHLLARGINEATAARLQQQLREMGAAVVVEPSSGAPSGAPGAPPPRPAAAPIAIGSVRTISSGAMPPVSGEPSGIGLSPASMKSISLAPLSRAGDAGDEMGIMGPLDNAPFATSSGAGPSPLPPRGSSAPKLSPLVSAPRPAAPPSAPPAAPAPAPAPARPAPMAPGGSLALDRRPEPPRRAPAPQRTPVPEEPAPNEGGGQRGKLQLDTDNVNVAKCVVHGLFYNKQQASGCVRCMELGRKTKQVMEEARSHGLSFSSNVRRAFLGLAVALILGFIPAAYYAQRINEEDVSRIRARQVELSKLVGTEDVIKEFDSLDGQIEKTRSRGMKVTLAIWVMVSAVAGAAWYRVTDS